MTDTETKAKGTSLAGGAIAAAVLDVLFEKGILTLDESRTVLTKALNALGPVMQSPEGYEASQIIGALLRGKFSARG